MTAFFVLDLIVVLHEDLKFLPFPYKLKMIIHSKLILLVASPFPAQRLAGVGRPRKGFEEERIESVPCKLDE